MEDIVEIPRPKRAGSIRRISVENFMCHSSLTIELGDRVNFITGQNGSGKSAILTALCVAFGIKARGTQRAHSMKDFIKTGCRYGLVIVELNNEGEDAFKPTVFGNTIIVERQINESASSFFVKDRQGRKVGTKKEDILEVVEHFNIDVENPCIIMTQDKSREFLHGGNEKDKFKFFFKATLLQQLSDILGKWEEKLNGAMMIIKELANDLLPAREELKQIEDRIRTLEEVEVQISEIDKLEKILAWSWVKEAEQALSEEEDKLVELKKRIPLCQKRIEEAELKVEQKRNAHAEKQALVQRMMDDTQALRLSQDLLQKALSQATRERVQAEEDAKRASRSLQEMQNRLRQYQNDLDEIKQRMLQDTQAEMNLRLQEIHELEQIIGRADEELKRLQGEESESRDELDAILKQKEVVGKEVEESQGQLRELRKYVQNLQSQQTNMVTAFGGNNVLNLLRAIEENHNRFTKPPVGPIGAHVALNDGVWSLAVEGAVGRMLNAFIVSNQRDTLLLRRLANQVRYNGLTIYVYDFECKLMSLPPAMLPDESLLTVLTSLKSEMPTVTNVLIDQGDVERQVLTKDYETGKHVVFDGGSRLGRNVKEVITMDGMRMYSRAGAETTLPRDRRTRSGRLGVRVDEQILQAEDQEKEIKSCILDAESRKRKIDERSRIVKDQAESFKRRRLEGERALRRKEFQLQDLKNAASTESDMSKESSLMELEQDIVHTQEEVNARQAKLQRMEFRLQEVKQKCVDAKSQLEQLCESARGDFETLQAAEQQLVTLEEELHASMRKLHHYQKVMEEKAVAVVQSQEQLISEMLQKIQVSREQASQVCPEEERQMLGEDQRSRGQLSNEINRLRDRVKRQTRESDSLEELTKKGNKLRKKIHAREKSYSNLEAKLEIIKDILEERKKRYRRFCTNMRRELTWGFNGHLGKKGCSGNVQIDFENHTLSLSVQMPQDASNTSVKDTRALSGGERSFSTLCFALTIHNMTEAPFRAMDEFDVFMDAVSRKISLDTAVDFAVEQGSQWIFITPHDISMVKGNSFVKKQQMPAPRP